MLACTVQQVAEYNNVDDIITFLEAVEKSGFKYINLEVGPFEKLLPLDNYLQILDKLFDYIKSSKLITVSIHSSYIRNFYFEEVKQENIKLYQQNLLKTVEIARILKVKFIVIHLGSFKNGDLDKFVMSNFNVLLPVLKKAKKYGIMLCGENHTNFEAWHGPNSTELNALCDYAKTQGFTMGQCFDFGHANISAEGLETLDKLKNLKVLHVHDNDGQNDLHADIKSGIIDWNKYKNFIALKNCIVVSEVRYSKEDRTNNLVNRLQSTYKLIKEVF